MEKGRTRCKRTQTWVATAGQYNAATGVVAGIATDIVTGESDVVTVDQVTITHYEETKQY